MASPLYLTDDRTGMTGQSEPPLARTPASPNLGSGLGYPNRTASNFEDTNGGLSMLEKSLERRRVNKEHNSNFRAGHVPINEAHLHKTGLRGRKRLFAYIILALVFLAALVNLLMTITIVLVLHIDWEPPMTFLRNGALRFNDPVDINSIYTTTGQLGGYQSQDLVLSAVGSSSSIQFQNTARSGASLEVREGETVLRSSHGFEINHPKTGKTIFKMPGARDEMVAPPGDYTILKSSSITAPKVQSDTGQDLMIESDKSVTLQGNEGLDLNGKQIDLQADSILLNPQGSLVLQGGQGIYINTTLIGKSDGITANKPAATTYKLCVCETSGRVFRVVADRPSPCANLDTASNPCK